MELYHGTSVPNLNKFKIGIKGNGECDIPANGIWLTDNEAYAISMAGIVSNKKNKKYGYTYKVKIKEDAVIIDTTKDLPEEVYKAYQNKITCLKRPFVKNKNWYYKFRTYIQNKYKNDNLCKDQISNHLYDFCRELGVDAINNALVKLSGEKVQIYGRHSLMLLNLKKCDGNLIKHKRV